MDKTASPKTKTPTPAKAVTSQAKTDHQSRKFSFRNLFKNITPYKIWLAIFLVLWTILSTYAGQIIAALPLTIILGEKLQQPGWMLLYYIVTYAITLTLIIIVPPQLIKLYRKHHRAKSEPKKLFTLAEKDLTATTKDLGVQKLPTFVDIGLAPIGYVAYLIIAAILTNIMSSFSWFNSDQAQDVGFGYFITNLDRVFALIAVVIIAPIAEELIMRGWLYGKLRNKWNIIAAILITSLSFAVLHGQWNVGVTVFALSLILCSLREITGTIWAGMLLHILSNGIAFYLLYVAI